MTKIEEIKNQIKTYDNMIEELIDSNAPDKVVGRLELKRQKLIERCKKLETTNTSTIVEKKEDVSAADSYTTIKKGQCLRIPAQNPYEGQVNERQELNIPEVDGNNSGEPQDKYAQKLEEIDKLNKTIEIYDDMILKMALHNNEDPALIDIKSKRTSLIEQVNRLVSETDDREYIPTAHQVLRMINELDIITDKLTQCRIGIRRTTKNLFKIITSPDYIPGDLPVEINDLMAIKKYKQRVEEQEQDLLRKISKFFNAKLTI